MKRCVISYILAIIVFITFLNILLYYVNKRRSSSIIEKFNENEDMLLALNVKIRDQEEKINVLKRARKIILEDDKLIQQKHKPIISETAATVSKPSTVKSKFAEKNVKKKNPKKHLSDLTMYDRSLGESWLNVKNHSMDNTQLLRQLLVDLGVETSKNVDKEKADYENYCLFRKLTKQCAPGRKDCINHCNPADSAQKIWG